MVTRYQSPLRYPGGKAFLAGYLARVIIANNLTGARYYEPFAGGAGAALRLLQHDLVSEVHLNDADPRIYAFWRSALNSTHQFVNAILETPLTIKEWRKQHQIVKNPSQYSTFEVGFAAFFMNRCNRSGVITGAGPIGGYAQAGNWDMSARFNRKALANRIEDLAARRNQINIYTMDALRFLKSIKRTSKDGTLVYVDPPYVHSGRRLYLNKYSERDHGLLAAYLLRRRNLAWVLTYDDCELVRQLYTQGCRRFRIEANYSMQKHVKEHEIVVIPNRLCIPT